MNILVKFPTRGRPERFIKAFRGYIDLASNKSLLTFLISLDHDDHTATPAFIETVRGMHPNILVHVGMSKNKIHAINRDMDKAPPFDILLLASDDMVPEVQAYDDTIRNTMALHFPDTDGVLWFNDGIKGPELNTLCILGKKYYDRFGYIYYPGYKSFFCDNEFMDTARSLKRQIYFDVILIRHMHLIRDASLEDDTYRRNGNQTFYENDNKLYESRKNPGKRLITKQIGFVGQSFQF
jgi:hypothetical protein